MTSEAKFARALLEGFRSKGVRQRLDILKRPAYMVGDRTAVALENHIQIPKSVGDPRGGQWGVVVKLSDDGLGVRFPNKVGRVTREFFQWSELSGAMATAAPRERKRKSVTPPRT